jgi:hypothetical protein
MLKRAQKPAAEIAMPDADIPMPSATPTPAPAPAPAKTPTALPPGIKEDPSGSGMNIVPKNQRTISPNDLPSVSNVSNNGQQSLSVVKAMQQEMVNFATLFVRSLSDLSRPTNVREDALQERKTDMFGKLLMKRFQGGTHSDQHLSNIISSMTNIGSKGNVSVPDGIWGDKTNQGLSNIIEMAQALESLQNDDVTKSKYDNELKNLNKLIPIEHNTLNSNQKLNLAPQITSHLKVLIELIKDFKKEFLDQNKDLLNQNESMIDFRSNQTLTDQEKKFLQTYSKEVVTTIGKTDITLGDLEHPDKLNVKLQQEGVDITDPKKVQEFINKIKSTANAPSSLTPTTLPQQEAR